MKDRRNQNRRPEGRFPASYAGCVLCGDLGTAIAVCAHEFGVFRAIVCDDHLDPLGICVLCPGCRELEAEHVHGGRLN